MNLVKIYARNYFLEYLLVAFKSRHLDAYPVVVGPGLEVALAMDGEGTHYPWGPERVISIYPYVSKPICDVFVT